MKTFLSATALALALVAAPVAAQDRDAAPGARTPIAAIDASTPEAAAEAFIEAHRRGDYFTAWYLLSPAAKRGFLTAVQYLNTRKLFPAVEGFQIPGSVFFAEERSDLIDDLMVDPALLFDDLMYAAERQDLLPFTFGPDAEITAVGTRDEPASLAMRTGGEPPLLGLELVRMSTGDWRLDRVHWAGSGTDARPWSGDGDD